MKKVLIISNSYPPLNLIGSLRIAKFVKYLPDFGWEPIVFTGKITPAKLTFGTLPDEMKKGQVVRTKDYNLNEIITGLLEKKERKGNQEDRIFRKKSILSPSLKEFLKGIYRNLAYWPDPLFLWFIFQKKKAAEVANEYKVDIVFSSSPEPTCHLIANYVSKKTGLPWVADFRDLWVKNLVWRKYGFLNWLETFWEKKVMTRTKKIITVSENLAEILKKMHKKEVIVIENGFDPDDFQKLPTLPPRKDLKLQILYTGRIYWGKIDPSLFFESLSELIKNNLIKKEKIQIDFYGRNVDILPVLVEKYDLQGVVFIHKKYLSYQESLTFQKNADLLLLLGSPKEETKGIYTGKIFEYLGNQRPILAIGPKGGAIENLLKKTKGGILCSNKEEIRKALLEYYQEFIQKGILEWKGDYQLIINRFSRKNLTKKLAQVLHHAIS